MKIFLVIVIVIVTKISLAKTRKEAQCELMYIFDSTNRSVKSYMMDIRNHTYE